VSHHRVQRRGTECVEVVMSWVLTRGGATYGGTPLIYINCAPACSLPQTFGRTEFANKHSVVPAFYMSTSGPHSCTINPYARDHTRRDSAHICGCAQRKVLLRKKPSGLLYLRLLNRLASREKLGVAGFCSVTVEMSSCLGSYGPSSGRTGRSSCYSYIHHFKTAL
jgi:hypothetical protein